jgi:hypothetical protein
MNDPTRWPELLHSAVTSGMLTVNPVATGVMASALLVQTLDMFGAAAIQQLRWAAARVGADGLVPLALQGKLEPGSGGWLRRS